MQDCRDALEADFCREWGAYGNAYTLEHCKCEREDCTQSADHGEFPALAEIYSTLGQLM